MSGGDPAEFPKPSDEEQQLQVAKEGKLDGVQMALGESGLPRGSLLTSNFEDVSAPTTSDVKSEPSFATPLMIRQSLQQAEQLKEDHRQTDQLIDKVLEQATEINRELILRNQMARKRRLLRELETMYSGSMHILVEAIRAEFDSI